MHNFGLAKILQYLIYFNFANVRNSCPNESFDKFLIFQSREILAACSRLQLHIMGIHTTVKGKLKPKEECPVIVAGGHSSFLDSWICSVELENKTLKKIFLFFN